MSHVMNTYNRWPIAVAKGSGSYLWDVDGRQYLDYTSGIAVNQFGHCYEPIVRAIQQQAEQLIHTSNLFEVPHQESLADALVEQAGYGKVFFCNSGAEANEAAIKLARRYQQKVCGNNRHEIITFYKSFHGRTLTTVTATAQPKYQEGYQPLPSGFVYAKFNDLEDVRQRINEQTAAIMFELVQGEGGVHVVDRDFLVAIKKLADEHGILLIVDEVQTGIGRTGSLFAWQQFDFEPDIFTLAKGLGGGLPIGACVAKESIAQAFVPGSHGTTFGGNPLATTVASTIIEELKKSDIQQRLSENCTVLEHKLRVLHGNFPEIINEIRGMGMLAGIELQQKIVVADIVKLCRENGMLVTAAGDNTLRMLPPLNTTKEELEQAFDILQKVFTVALEAAK